MKAAGMVVAMLLAASRAMAQADLTPPPPPGPLTVEKPTLQTTGATFKVSWATVLDPPANVPVPVYRWTAGFNDGTGPMQGTVAATTLMLRVPYHPKGAASGFVCVLAEDAAGNVSLGATCAGLAVPAQPASSHTIEYREPAMKADGTPLQTLAAMRLYWRVDDGPETAVTLPASSPAGGQERRYVLTVPATSGTLFITLTAIDATGNESVRTATTTKVIGAN